MPGTHEGEEAERLGGLTYFLRRVAFHGPPTGGVTAPCVKAAGAWGPVVGTKVENIMGAWIRAEVELNAPVSRTASGEEMLAFIAWERLVSGGLLPVAHRVPCRAEAVRVATEVDFVCVDVWGRVVVVELKVGYDGQLDARGWNRTMGDLTCRMEDTLMNRFLLQAACEAEMLKASYRWPESLTHAPACVLLINRQDGTRLVEVEEKHTEAAVRCIRPVEYVKSLLEIVSK